MVSGHNERTFNAPTHFDLAGTRSVVVDSNNVIHGKKKKKSFFFSISFSFYNLKCNLIDDDV